MCSNTAAADISIISIYISISLSLPSSLPLTVVSLIEIHDIDDQKKSKKKRKKHMRGLLLECMNGIYKGPYHNK